MLVLYFSIVRRKRPSGDGIVSLERTKSAFLVRLTGKNGLDRTKSAFLVRLTGKIGLDRTKTAFLVRSTAETVRKRFS